MNDDLKQNWLEFEVIGSNTDNSCLCDMSFHICVNKSSIVSVVGDSKSKSTAIGLINGESHIVKMNYKDVMELL